jgi:hypothetical protein
MHTFRIAIIGSGMVAALLAGAAANAQQVITDPSGNFSVGLGANGELYDSTSGVGVRRLSDGYDPLAPGSPRDSWGVEIVGGGSAFADQFDFGNSNLTGTTYTIGPSSASATTTTSIGLTVNQQYTFVSPNVLEIRETVTNISGASADVLFGRDVDWDVAPTEFNENTFGPIGANPAVVGSSYYGFENPDPSIPYGSSCFSGCNFTSDLGAGIQVNLGTLLNGQSATIDYFYGISQLGQDVNGLIGEAQSDGAQYIIATQSSENGAYPNLGIDSAFIGVGNVPEPSTWAMMLVGFAGLGYAGYRRSKQRIAA